MRDLSPKMFNSVSCPTCRVGPGKRCVLHSGGLRNDPHVDRKLRAIETVKSAATARAKPSSVVD